MGATSLVNVGADAEVVGGAAVDAAFVGGALLGAGLGCEGEVADCAKAKAAVKGIKSANQGRPRIERVLQGKW